MSELFRRSDQSHGAEETMSPSQSSSGGGGRHKDKDWDVQRRRNRIEMYVGEKKKDG